MKIAVLGGLGIEGRATTRFLKKKYPKADLTILDQKNDPNYLKNLSGFDVIYRSPGVPYNLKEVQKALKKGVTVTSATEVFLEGARGTIIGITGTKGKSTTTTLIYEVLKKDGRDVHIAGNIGKPAINLLPELRKNSITVMELSSFQLQGISRSPHIAVVLDIFPDHLDAHKNFKEYVEAKANIAAHQRKDDLVFYAPDNKYAKSIASRSKGQQIAVPWRSFPTKLRIPGIHNIKNAAMAAAVVSHFNVSPVTTLDVINNFQGLPQRLKLTKKINGVSIYNDSASTNPNTIAAALLSFPGKSKILIAGGKDKGLDYKPLKDTIFSEDVRAVILFGENKAKIRQAIGNPAIIHNAINLKKAMRMAIEAAQTGDIVIFSPGAASFDTFDNYLERGKEFDRIVKGLKG